MNLYNQPEPHSCTHILSDPLQVFMGILYIFITEQTVERLQEIKEQRLSKAREIQVCSELSWRSCIKVEYNAGITNGVPVLQ